MTEAGIEPAARALKVRCSTTELLGPEANKQFIIPLVNYEPIDGIAIAAKVGVWACVLWFVLLASPTSSPGRIMKWVSASVLILGGLMMLWNTSVQLWSVPPRAH